LLLFLFTCLGYDIFSQFYLFGNIVQLLLLSVAMTNALSELFLFIYIYMCCVVWVWLFPYLGIDGMWK